MEDVSLIGVTGVNNIASLKITVFMEYGEKYCTVKLQNNKYMMMEN